jgi:hypothetical protein
MPDDRYAQHADGQQVLGRELIRRLRPVTPRAKPLKVGTGVSSPPGGVLGEIRPLRRDKCGQVLARLPGRSYS